MAGELADVGINVLETVQPEANDVDKLKALHGDRLAFWGTMGAQSTFPFGTAQDIQSEVHRRIAVMGKCGGLMLAPAHVLEPEVPVENVLAFVNEIKRTAEGKGNLVPPTIEAVKNYASLGEVVESLRSVFGFFERPIVF